MTATLMPRSQYLETVKARSRVGWVAAFWQPNKTTAYVGVSDSEPQHFPTLASNSITRISTFRCHNCVLLMCYSEP